MSCRPFDNQRVLDLVGYFVLEAAFDQLPRGFAGAEARQIRFGNHFIEGLLVVADRFRVVRWSQRRDVHTQETLSILTSYCSFGVSRVVSSDESVSVLAIIALFRSQN